MFKMDNAICIAKLLWYVQQTIPVGHLWPKVYIISEIKSESLSLMENTILGEEA